MRCEETNALIHAYVDGELDLIHSLEIDRHLTDCPACAQIAERIAAVRAAVGSAPRFVAPPTLAERIRAMLPEAERQRPSVRPIQWQSLAAAAVLIAAVLVGWALTHSWSGASSQDRLAQEIVSNHIRSLLPDHALVDVASTDRHTVKPWFAGRVDFSPQVEDLKDQGIPLVGGRLDVLDGRPVAALVYQRGRHVINLFMCPLKNFPPSAERPQAITYQGFHVISWAGSDLKYCAVSDLNEAELREFVTLVQSRSSKAP